MLFSSEKATNNRDSRQEVTQVNKREDHVGEIWQKHFEEQLVCVVLLLQQNLYEFVSKHLVVRDTIEVVVKVEQVVSHPFDFEDPYFD